MTKELKLNGTNEWEPELPPGHRERFISKLESRLHRGQHRLIRFQAITIAASIAIVVSLSIIMILRTNQFNQRKTLLANISVELYETEMYYQHSIENRLNQLKNTIDDPDEVVADLDEMDENLMKVNLDLERNPGDERIVQAILTIYQAKLDLINEVLIRLRKS
jgi:hypothetical protein